MFLLITNLLNFHKLVFYSIACQQKLLTIYIFWTDNIVLNRFIGLFNTFAVVEWDQSDLVARVKNSVEVLGFVPSGGSPHGR